MTRTMKELAKEAIDIQNASNLSGIVHSFSRTITELRELLNKEEGFSTEKLNQHPVCVLYSDKITSLTDSYSVNTFSKAYEWAELQSAEDDIQIFETGDEVMTPGGKGKVLYRRMMSSNLTKVAVYSVKLDSVDTDTSLSNGTTYHANEVKKL